MAGRIRSIKPEINSDAKAARLSHAAWRLWVSTWPLADDVGRLPADPAMLAGQVFWAQPADVEACLDELEAAGLVERYSVRGDSYMVIRGFRRHQRIDRPSPPKWPGPEDSTSPREDSANPRRVLDADGKGIGKEGNRDPAARAEPEPNPSTEGSRPEEVKEAAKPSPSARPAFGPEAGELAELLRKQILAAKPDHALGQAAKWKSVRQTWGRELDVMLRVDKRSAARATQLIRWVFGNQNGAEYRFVVESAKALREKWDRIEAAMSRRHGARANGMQAATGGDEERDLVPLRRKET